LKNASTALNAKLTPEQAAIEIGKLEKIYQKVLSGGAAAQGQPVTDNEPTQEEIMAELQRRGEVNG
jgi:hypothetical protein